MPGPGFEKDPPGYRLTVRQSSLLEKVGALAVRYSLPDGTPKAVPHFRSIFRHAGAGCRVTAPGRSLTPLLASVGLARRYYLNFMPCVLPVLSIKVIGLVKTGGDRRRIFASSICFSPGS